MGCGSESSTNENNNKVEKIDEEEKEKTETLENKSKESELKKSSNFDKHTKNYFKNFDENEISLILERKKLIDSEINFVFLYSKFDIDYTDKNYNKTKSLICKEYLVCYVNPNYTGNFGYESQIIGFCPDKISLEYCSIQDKKVPTKMRNTGKIICVLIIEENYKDDILNDIMIFEFSYKITQLKKYGMSVIDVHYKEKPLSGSIMINYDSKLFKILSCEKSEDDSKNKFYISNKDKYSLIVMDKNNDLSIKKDGTGRTIDKLIYEKFSEEEIKSINNSLKNMIFKPFENNIIYEKMVHNLKDNKDSVKGYILIFHPSFDKNYFELCEGVDKRYDKVDFLVNKLKVNDKLLINIKKNDEKNRIKPENYYESTYNSHRYNIRSNDDFILFEFDLEGIDSEKNNEEIEYNLDGKKIFNFYLNYEASYKFEIILNHHEVYFKDDKTYKYKYKKTKETITFEGIWKLKKWDNKKSKKYLPDELVIKRK